jgi:hypothetical protein
MDLIKANQIGLLKYLSAVLLLMVFLIYRKHQLHQI